MNNFEVYQTNPLERTLPNEGVAAMTASDEVLQYELRTFVCEGQYAKGLDTILTSYLASLDKPDQAAVWVSGFFGSGKSHLVKMLRYLWTDHEFPDKSRARGLAKLPTEIADQFKELSTRGRQYGGLHAAAGTLGSKSPSITLAVLEILFASLGLPPYYRTARFVLWLKKEGLLEKVQAGVKGRSREWDGELNSIGASTVIADSVLDANPNLANSTAAMLELIKKEFPRVTDLSVDQMIAMVGEALGTGREVPCTAIILDEVQQFIGSETNDRSYIVQEVAEALCKRFKGRILVVGTGQEALSPTTPALGRLMGRFTRRIHLSDVDVETVIRKVVLAKKPDKEAAIAKVMNDCRGELSRHLKQSKLAPKAEDDENLVADYPLLPVRQRFWEWVLRRLDSAGLHGQLRTQLKIAHEAAKATAKLPLGSVAPADFTFDQLQGDLLRSDVLAKELHHLIETFRASRNPDDNLRGRLCALIFLISKLPHEAPFDLGIRAIEDTLADLLVVDLIAGSTDLRKKVPALLEGLVTDGKLLKIDNEYRLQTQEGTTWELGYRKRLSEMLADTARLRQERSDLFKREISGRLAEIELRQGVTNVTRRLAISFADRPEETGKVPVWVRNEWDDREGNVLADARAAGDHSPLITVYVPKRAPEDLRQALAEWKAAEFVLNEKGHPTGTEGVEARQAMQTRARMAENRVNAIFNDQIIAGTRVILGGGEERSGLMLSAVVEEAAKVALQRQFPEFKTGDHKGWETLLAKVKEGGAPTLDKHLSFTGSPETHPVCSTVLAFVGTGKKGSEIRKHFGAGQFGWPQDTVDGALMVLFLAGHIRAIHNGGPLERTRLQTNIGVAEFRSETIMVSATQRLAVQGLCAAMAAPVTKGEEAAAAPALLAKIMELGKAAGGETPLPATPDLAHLRELISLSGNEQVVAVAAQKDRLAKDITQWQAASVLAAKRLSHWETLSALCRHADAAALPIAAEAAAQMTAIRDGRRLLASPDPVPVLCDKLTAALRAALIKAHAGCRDLYEGCLNTLAASPAWKKLAEEQRAAIRDASKIRPVDDIAVGTEDELLASLSARSIDGWGELVQALPERFKQAELAAVKASQPKAVRVSLPSATITTTDELETWLRRVRDDVAGKLKDGPVIL